MNKEWKFAYSCKRGINYIYNYHIRSLIRNNSNLDKDDFVQHSFIMLYEKYSLLNDRDDNYILGSIRRSMFRFLNLHSWKAVKIPHLYLSLYYNKDKVKECPYRVKEILDANTVYRFDTIPDDEDDNDHKMYGIMRDTIKKRDVNIGKLLDLLEPITKQIVIMHHLWGMTLKEVAEELGYPYNSIKYQVQKGKNLIRKREKNGE